MNGTSSVCCTSVVVSSSKIEVDGNTVEVTFIDGKEVTIASGCTLDVTLTGGRTIEVDVTLACCRVDVMFTGGRVDVMFTGGRVDVMFTGGRVDVMFTGGRVDVMFTGGRVDVMFTGGRVKVTFGDGCSEVVNRVNTVTLLNCNTVLDCTGCTLLVALMNGLMVGVAVVGTAVASTENGSRTLDSGDISGWTRDVCCAVAVVLVTGVGWGLELVSGNNTAVID